MKKPLILIDDFKGGMTLNEKFGRADQFHIGSQLDFTSKIGKLAPGHAWGVMTESSNSYMPDEIGAMLFTQEDNQMYFGGDDAKIYKRSNSEAIVFETASDQTGVIRGFKEHAGYMYYPQNTTLGRADLAGGYEHDFQTGLTSNTYHPMHVSVDANMYVGGGTVGGNYIDKVNSSGVYASSALDLPSGWKPRTINDFGHLYLAIGADKFATGSAPSETKIYLWNRTGTTWQDEIIVPEKGIKATLWTAGWYWIWAGRSCNLYVVQDGSRMARKVWSFSKENPGDLLEVYPNSVQERNGTVYFGLSGVGSESIGTNPNGIYSFPADPTRFSLSVVKDAGGGDDRFKSLGLWRDATGDILFASQYDASATNKELLIMEDIGNAPYKDTCTYESFRYYAPSNKRMKTQHFGVTFDALPTGCVINLYYKKNNDTSWTQLISNFTTATATEKILKYSITCDSLKLKLTVRGGSVSSYLRPFVSSVFVTGGLITKKL